MNLWEGIFDEAPVGQEMLCTVGEPVPVDDIQCLQQRYAPFSLANLHIFERCDDPSASLCISLSLRSL